MYYVNVAFWDKRLCYKAQQLAGNIAVPNILLDPDPSDWDAKKRISKWTFHNIVKIPGNPTATATFIWTVDEEDYILGEFTSSHNSLSIDSSQISITLFSRSSLPWCVPGMTRGNKPSRSWDSPEGEHPPWSRECIKFHRSWCQCWERTLVSCWSWPSSSLQQRMKLSRKMETSSFALTSES